MSAADGRRPGLAQRLAEDEIVAAPGAYDVLSAMLIEQAGFSTIYLTGNGQTASALGLPDLGMVTLTEMVERVRRVAERTTATLIADADVGFGSLLSVRRAVQELEAAGAGAIQIEDQESPKKCGHELGRVIVDVPEMIGRLRAAVDGRRHADTLIIARTDARTTHGLDEAIARGRAYLENGADVIFVESPESEDELRTAAREIPGPVLANMVEGGRTPYLSWRDLGAMGIRVAIYPSVGFLAASGAVREAVGEVRDRGRAESTIERMMTLKEYHQALHFDELADLERSLHAEPGVASEG